MDRADMVSLLIITGTMGAGKTTVLAEASDLLAAQQMAHAAIDMDALGLAVLPGAARNDEAMYRNFRSICDNYAALGVERFLVARAVETRAELELCREIVCATETVVCRVGASIGTMEGRVKLRELGVLQGQYVSRVAELSAILDRARLEDFTIANEDRPITEVAREVLMKARWISGGK